MVFCRMMLDGNQTRQPVPTLQGEKDMIAPLAHCPINGTTQRRLRELVQLWACDVVRSPWCAEILVLAFAEQTNLPWARLNGLHIHTLQALLESPAFATVQSISLCPRQMQGLASPQHLASVLRTSSSPYLAEFTLYQEPRLDGTDRCDRDHDTDSAGSVAAGQEADALWASAIFTTLLSSPTIMAHAGLRLFFTGAHAATATKRRWFTPPASVRTPTFFKRLPVSNVFVRVAAASDRAEIDTEGHPLERLLHPTCDWACSESVDTASADITPYRPVYIHTSDMLQQAPAFVAGWLRMLSSLLIPNHGGSAPRSTEEGLRALPKLMASPIVQEDAADVPRLRFAESHPAVENEAVRMRPRQINSTGRIRNPRHDDSKMTITINGYGSISSGSSTIIDADTETLAKRTERALNSERAFDATRSRCWPHVRDLAPGSWHVVVSVDHNRSRARAGAVAEQVVPVVRYAFLRVNPSRLTPLWTDTPKARLVANDDNSDNSGPLFDIVGGLDAFLAVTTDDGADGTDGTAVAHDVLEGLNKLARDRQAQIDSMAVVPRSFHDPPTHVETMPRASALHALADFLAEVVIRGGYTLDVVGCENENMRLYPEVFGAKAPAYDWFPRSRRPR